MQERGIRITRSERDGSRWEMAVRAPSRALRPHVRSLVGFDESAPGPRSRRQFPGASVVLIVDLGEPLRVALGGDPRTAARHAGGFAVGLGDRFATTEHAGRQRGIQIDLTPTGARRLLGLPLCEITGHVVSLHDLLPARHRSFSEKLEEAGDWASRLELVDAVLCERLREGRLETAQVDWAVAQIEASGGAQEVGALARELGYSRKHVISLFRDQVGVTPKLLARLVRFERVMERLRGDEPVRWADLALEHGYFDQSHLARDVRHFTGLTPTRARACLLGELPG